MDGQGIHGNRTDLVQTDTTSGENNQLPHRVHAFTNDRSLQSEGGDQVKAWSVNVTNDGSCVNEIDVDEYAERYFACDETPTSRSSRALEQAETSAAAHQEQSEDKVLEIDIRLLAIQHQHDGSENLTIAGDAVQSLNPDAVRSQNADDKNTSSSKDSVRLQQQQPWQQQLFSVSSKEAELRKSDHTASNAVERLLQEEDIACCARKEERACRTRASENKQIAPYAVERLLQEEDIACCARKEMSLAGNDATAALAWEENMALANHPVDAMRVITSQTNDIVPGAFGFSSRQELDTTILENNMDEERELTIEGAVLVEDTGSYVSNPTSGTAWIGGYSTDIIVLAEILPHAPKPKHTPLKRQYGWLGLIFLFVIILSVILLSAISRTAEDYQPSMRPILQSATTQPFDESLPPLIKSLIKAQWHPYNLANLWMHNDPHREQYPSERQRQRFHLVSYYYHLGGNNWTRNDNWLDYEVSECDWYWQSDDEYNMDDSFPICDDQHILRKFNLAANNLIGTAPTVTSDFLPFLKAFNIGHNQIKNLVLPIHMAEIEVLNVEHNGMEGKITAPAVPYQAFRIRVIRMGGNAFSGRDYSGAYRATPNVEVLDNHGNKIEGPLYPEIGLQCKNLTHVNYQGNIKTGSIPTEHGLLTNMLEFNVANNPLLGTIPSELGLLTKLTFLDVSGTSITGEIPQPLCEMSRIGLLDLVAECNILNCSGCF